MNADGKNLEPLGSFEQKETKITKAKTTSPLWLAFVPLVNFCSIHRSGTLIRLFSISVIRVISGQNFDGCGLAD
jgi:hypothetical protein